ncbi:MAG: signal peptide peptidase SppA [Pirellulales bacterium]|nr:signal peptide peptidase SppA [Pirellulales bacterium]
MTRNFERSLGSKLLIAAACAAALFAAPRAVFAQEAATASKPADKAATDKPAAEKPAEPKKVRLAHIAITGSLPESSGEMSLFGDLGVDLRKMIARLDQAAEDKEIAGVILAIDAGIGRGKANELRDAIKRTQAAGKKVYAQLESISGSQFVVAAACDEIVLPESGIVLMPAIHGEFGFYKDMLAKIGVEADFIHMGEAKGAAEPFTQTKFSDAVRENMTALIDDLHDQTITQIAADRHVKIDVVRDAIDRSLLTAKQAKELGLVDRIAYPDEFRGELAKAYDAEKLVYVLNYAKTRVDADFSGPMGMMKLFQTILGGGASADRDGGPKLAIVYAVGAITTGKSEQGLGGSAMGSTTIVEALDEAAKDDKIKAIVLRVDSPGGSALASDLIWRKIQTIDKPVVASMGDVAASGGYYISMGADRIFAEPGTVTGSIGVVGGKLCLGGLYDKIGMTTETIARGKNSGIFSTTQKFSDSEREALQAMMEDIYDQFTSKAAAGRKMDVAQLKSLAEGRVYTGRVAKQHGLVDELGTLKDAIAAAKRLGGLDPNQKVPAVVLPKPANPLESLLGADMDQQREASLQAMLAAVHSLAPELSGPLVESLQLRQVFREPVAAILPFWFEIR